MTDTKTEAAHTKREFRGWIALTRSHSGLPTYIQVRNIGEVYVDSDGETCIETAVENPSIVRESLDEVLDAIFYAEDGFNE